MGNNISKFLSIIGESKGSVTTNSSSFASGYGITVISNNVTLKHFFLKSPLTHADGYGIHTSGSNTVTFENLLVEDSGRRGVDFIGCNNIKINSLKAKNNSRSGMQ